MKLYHWKEPLKNNDDEFTFSLCQKSILYQGTKIVQLKSDVVKAMVLRTSFSSLKGQLVRTMIFPVPSENKFIKEALRFFFLFGMISIAIYAPCIYDLYQQGFPTDKLTIRAMNVITWVIPPQLPIFFTLNQTFSLIRLRNKQIIGIFPEKLTQAGEISVCCFDKTGTLTTPFMMLLSVLINKDK